MAEPLSITVAVLSILKSLASATKSVNDIRQAPVQAHQVSNELQATSAILKSLDLNLNRSDLPRDFLIAWEPSLKLVLDNLDMTLDNLTRRLNGRSNNSVDGGTSRKSGPKGWSLLFVKRLKWVLSKEDGQILLQQLRGYIQMLALAQNALLQASVHELIRSSIQIKERIGGDSRYPLSSSAASRIDVESLIEDSGLSHMYGSSTTILPDLNETMNWEVHEEARKEEQKGDTEDEKVEAEVNTVDTEEEDVSRDASIGVDAPSISPRNSSPLREVAEDNGSKDSSSSEDSDDGDAYTFRRTASVSCLQYTDWQKGVNTTIYEKIDLGPGKVHFCGTSARGGDLWIEFEPQGRSKNSSSWTWNIGEKFERNNWFRPEVWGIVDDREHGLLLFFSSNSEAKGFLNGTWQDIEGDWKRIQHINNNKAVSARFG